MAPFEVSITDTKKLCAVFLLKNFGAQNGMLIFTDYDAIQPYQDQLIALGYGFSVLQKPEDNEAYKRGISRYAKRLGLDRGEGS